MMENYWIKDHNEAKDSDLELKRGPRGEFVGLDAARACMGRGIIS